MSQVNQVQLIKRKNLFTNGYYNHVEPGFVELWDFSQANFSQSNRVQAVSTVASVCYGNDSLEPNTRIFDALTRESIGLPSSSFEFVPVLLNLEKKEKIINAFDEIKNMMFLVGSKDAHGNNPGHNSNFIEDLNKEIEKINKEEERDFIPNIIRYGYSIDLNNIITNLRALVYDLEYLSKLSQKFNLNLQSISKEELQPDRDIWFNDENDLELIKRNFFVFRKKITIRDARQDERHRRAIWQELSRRYTTGYKIPIDFRLTEAMATKENIDRITFSIQAYNQALSNKVKAQEARDILPVSIYTTIWNAWYPDGLANYFNLRTKSKSQTEIRALAQTMQELIEDSKGD